ncbi:unnamed protein product [Ranitomeya imitator]|uniref:Uncharacterized protein n=1 Tax=Ranitomeya imitator TaxID=111125 RepID=A0ABN9LYA7_9NEOB|nr:unnamed protein product [Ranitomeya imitator]
MACNIRLPVLENQLTCPICLEIFKDPVMLQCGHSYCKDCLWGLMKDPHTQLLCPVCRQEVDYSSSPPNVTLKHLIETLKILSEDQAVTETCPHHNNPLCLYCEQDQEVICGLCGTIGDHRQHPIKPLTSVYSRMKEEVSALMTELQKERQGLEEHISKLTNNKTRILDLVLTTPVQICSGEWDQLQFPAQLGGRYTSVKGMQEADPQGILPYFSDYKMHRAIRRTPNFQLENGEKK